MYAFVLRCCVATRLADDGILPQLAVPFSLKGDVPSSREGGCGKQADAPTTSKGAFEKRAVEAVTLSLLAGRLFIALFALAVASLVALSTVQPGDQARVVVTGGIIAKTEEGGANGSVYSSTPSRPHLHSLPPPASPPPGRGPPSPHPRSNPPPSATPNPGSSPAALAPVPFKPRNPPREPGHHREYALVDKYIWHQLDNQRAHVCYAGVPCSFLLLVPKHALNGTNGVVGEEKGVGEAGAGAAKPAAKSAKGLPFYDVMLELEQLLRPHTQVLMADVMVILYGPSLQYASLVSQTATPNGPLLQLSVLIWDMGDYRGVVRADCTHESAVGSRYFTPRGPGEVRYFRLHVLSPESSPSPPPSPPPPLPPPPPTFPPKLQPHLGRVGQAQVQGEKRS
ncbi:hypothetical protein CLOM_g21058 [Closterium sp. NIES-68]|nr:hypothetical protein CLOM_g21058 [Closterium sp. NIES-68]